ncbi:hypothetical protein [Bradyrhizobium sp. RT3a]|uniref:hypothetical protein n=1 Tax=unclassified Bradyrhizobium TaxID=2631580 RepID=UPI003398C00F
MSCVEQIAVIARPRGIKLIAVQLPYLRDCIDFLDHQEGYRRFSGVWHEFESEATRAWLDAIGIRLFDLARSSIDDDLDILYPSCEGRFAE